MTLTIILGVVILVLIYVVRNLLLKNEKQEDVLVNYLNFLDRLSKQIEYSDEKLKLLDSKDMFKSDDEIGWFFQQVKNIQAQLNSFKLEEDEKK